MTRAVRCFRAKLVTVNMYILILILVILTLLHVYFSRQASDPYGSFHVPFNKIPGGPDPPRTEWLNMGFWKVQRITIADSYQRIIIDT
jgi:hypothetical protein